MCGSHPLEALPGPGLPSVSFIFLLVKVIRLLLVFHFVSKSFHLNVLGGVPLKLFYQFPRAIFCFSKIFTRILREFDLPVGSKRLDMRRRLDICDVGVSAKWIIYMIVSNSRQSLCTSYNTKIS